jgi:hypothetical protein
MRAANCTLRRAGHVNVPCLSSPPRADGSQHPAPATPRYVQDNWFVLTAVLKDQYGMLLEEDTAARPACVACRRTHLAISMSKLV